MPRGKKQAGDTEMKKQMQLAGPSEICSRGGGRRLILLSTPLGPEGLKSPLLGGAEGLGGETQGVCVLDGWRFPHLSMHLPQAHELLTLEGSFSHLVNNSDAPYLRSPQVGGWK